jgi:hypothetical protein
MEKKCNAEFSEDFPLSVSRLRLIFKGLCQYKVSRRRNALAAFKYLQQSADGLQKNNEWPVSFFAHYFLKA